jgi:uroporphyrinogen decarboxylase
MITHRKRIEDCLTGNIPDRPPIALWRHFPVDDQTPQSLAKATLNYQKTFDFDFVKLTPASSFCLKDWGAKDEWHGATEGTRDYTHRVVNHPEDWLSLNILDPYKGYLGEQLECLKLVNSGLDGNTPVIQTVFSPLSQAKNLVGSETILIHLRRYPEALHAGLKIISETTRLFVEAVVKSGTAGIFYAVQHAQYGLLSPQEYKLFGMKYDLDVLEPTKQLWFNMLHLHGREPMFTKFVDYPVQVINWHDRETPPSLGVGLKEFSGVVCGGLRRIETMVLGDPEKVINEAQDAIQETEGTRFILGTGCVVPIIAPFGNIMAARRSVDFL